MEPNSTRLPVVGLGSAQVLAKVGLDGPQSHLLEINYAKPMGLLEAVGGSTRARPVDWSDQDRLCSLRRAHRLAVLVAYYPG